jgi:Ca-activated chloride channel family protein
MERFGLVGWLEKTRIHLPLKGVECRFRVCGDLVGVEMDQIFHQDNRQPLDCLYTFPLPGDAAVYRCEMHVDGRRVTARVEELQRAIELAQQKKDLGYRTALARMERDNLFTLELGNIAPGDVVVIRFAYFQTVTRLEEETSFNIPFCPGVRYIPGEPLLRSNSGRGVQDDTDQVPDASRISPPRIDRLHPDAAYLAVEGQIDAEVTEVRSPSHALIVKDGSSGAQVRLAEKGAVPDCDLAMRWTERPVQALQSAAWLTRRASESYALLRLVAPREMPSVSAHSQDVYFLVDRSGSMQGMKWAKACEAFRAFLRTLEPQDRGWATFFETRFQDLAGKPLPPAALLADAGVKGIEAVGTGGGTELLPALNHVLASIDRHSNVRNVAMVLITDGQVGNEGAILDALKTHRRVRVHTFGVDTAVNDAFLKKLAAQQRGTCYLVTPSDDIAGTVAKLGTRLRRPVLSDIQIHEACEPADACIPDLHAGEILNLPIRIRGELREIKWVGKRSDGTTAAYRCVVGDQALEAVPLLWARRRMECLLAEDRAQDAIRLARQHNLVCPGTAFVAWDETEKVALGQGKLDLYQPAMEVRGWARLQDTGMCLGTLAAFDSDSFGVSANRTPLRIKSMRGGDDDALSQRVGYVAPAASDRSAERRGPLIQKAPSAAWRLALEQDELLQLGAVGSQLLDWLEQWSLADPPQQRMREAKLDELATLVSEMRTSRKSRTARLEALWAWVEAHFRRDPGFLKPLREVLQRMVAPA